MAGNNKFEELLDDVSSGDALIDFNDGTPNELDRIKSKLTTLLNVYNKPYPHSFVFSNNNAGVGATILIFNKNFEGSAANRANKFILTSIQENRTEKFQIFETFGEPVLFFFNEKTKVYSVSGFLAEGDHKVGWGLFEKDSSSWSSEFRDFWDNVLRGSKLVENKQIAVLTYLDNLLYGYPVNLSMQIDANNPFMTPFSFNMIVTKHRLKIKRPKYSDLVDSLSDDDKGLFFQYMQALEEAEDNLKEKYAILETIKPGDVGARQATEQEITTLKNTIADTSNSLILLLNQASYYDR